jgi:hypothetical protein
MASKEEHTAQQFEAKRQKEQSLGSGRRRFQTGRTGGTWGSRLESQNCLAGLREA